MPTYTVSCPKCGQEYDHKLTFSDFTSVKEGKSELPCRECSAPVGFLFKPQKVTFHLKDGEGGGWPSKVLKENKYRAEHRVVMGRRERDHVFKNTLQPNYNGTETGTWKEAQELARKERGNLSAATYDAKVKGVTS